MITVRLSMTSNLDWMLFVTWKFIHQHILGMWPKNIDPYIYIMTTKRALELIKTLEEKIMQGIQLYSMHTNDLVGFLKTLPLNLVACTRGICCYPPTAMKYCMDN